MILIFDDASKNAKLSLCQSDLLPRLQSVTETLCKDQPELAYVVLLGLILFFKPSYSRSVPVFHPEYGRFMIETTPGSPYTGSLPDLLSVEKDMRYRSVGRTAQLARR